MPRKFVQPAFWAFGGLTMRRWGGNGGSTDDPLEAADECVDVPFDGCTEAVCGLYGVVEFAFGEGVYGSPVGGNSTVLAGELGGRNEIGSAGGVSGIVDRSCETGAAAVALGSGPSGRMIGGNASGDCPREMYPRGAPTSSRCDSVGCDDAAGRGASNCARGFTGADSAAC